jgi:DUF1365 family protein
MTVRLHAGRMVHVRHTPFLHRFGYRMWMLSADLDALDRLPSRLLRHNRFGLVALHDRDHGPRDGSPLRPWVEARLAEAGMTAFAWKIRLLVIPRVVGYAFNPITFYLCHDAEGKLGAVLHQVKNTFGGQTSYVTAATGGGDGKRMHVSPFFDMQGGYRFALHLPADADSLEDMFVAIRYGAAGEARLTATLALDSAAYSNAMLLRLLAAMPLMPMKVIAAIHWQALKLWLRGARFHRAPAARPELAA